MKNKIITIGIIILIVVVIFGVYVLVQDQKIKAGLVGVEQSQVVEDSAATSTNAATVSLIALERANGAWAVDSKSEYTIDPSSLIFTFTGYKPGGEHIGTFDAMKTFIMLDKTGTPVAAQILIDPTSVKTDSEKLDTHLQAPEFFDTAKYPGVTVDIKEIKKEGDSTKALTNITIKDVTKTFLIPVKIETQSEGIQFSVDTKINIADFKMAYGPVQNEVRVTLSGMLKKK